MLNSLFFDLEIDIEFAYGNSNKSIRFLARLFQPVKGSRIDLIHCILRFVSDLKFVI